MAVSSCAACHSPSPVRLTSTLVTGPVPDQALPRTVCGPTSRVDPAGGPVIRARTRIRLTISFIRLDMKNQTELTRRTNTEPWTRAIHHQRLQTHEEPTAD